MDIQHSQPKLGNSPAVYLRVNSRIVLAVVLISFMTMGVGYGSHGPNTALPDSQIKTAIVERLTMDTRVNPSQIQIEVKQGHAVLSGLVESLEEKFLMEHIIATSVLGLMGITNDISVRPALTKDDELAQQIWTQLKSLPALDNHKLNVIVDDGIVRLEGTVPKPRFRKMARRIVEAVPGVKRVDNFIKLNGPQRPDADIQKDVGTYLRYSPFVNLEDMDYQVEKGVITVKGLVEGVGILNLLAKDLDKIDGVVQVELSQLQVKTLKMKG